MCGRNIFDSINRGADFRLGFNFCAVLPSFVLCGFSFDCKLPDRSLFAVSIATASILFKKEVKHYGATLADTVAMITETPARIMGLKNKGKIRPGFDADAVIFDKELKIRKVLTGGRLVADNDRISNLRAGI